MKPDVIEPTDLPIVLYTVLYTIIKQRAALVEYEVIYDYGLFTMMHAFCEDMR